MIPSISVQSYKYLRNTLEKQLQLGRRRVPTLEMIQLMRRYLMVDRALQGVFLHTPDTHGLLTPEED